MLSKAGTSVTSTSCTGSGLSARGLLEHGPGEPGREEVPVEALGAAGVSIWCVELDSGCSADMVGVIMGEVPMTELVTRMEGVLCSVQLKAG